MTQYKARSIRNYLNETWSRLIPEIKGVRTFEILQSEEKPGLEKIGYVGTANAVEQNIEFIDEWAPENVYVLAGDHVYFMDVRELKRAHVHKQADLTVCAKLVSIEEAAGAYGVLVVNEDNRIIGFEEKPERPTPIPNPHNDPNLEGKCLASMGNYAFKTAALKTALERDASKTMGSKEQVIDNPALYSLRDFGFDIIPQAIRDGMDVYAWDFSDHRVEGAQLIEAGFWMDVGRVRQYFDANMLIAGEINPPLDHYNRNWLMRSKTVSSPGAALQHCQVDRKVTLAGGSIATGAHLDQVVGGYHVRIEKGSVIGSSIFDDGVQVNKDCRLHNVIVERGVHIPKQTGIGDDPRHYEVDGQGRNILGLPVYDGVILVPKDHQF